jgi:hypothetical protein
VLFFTQPSGSLSQPTGRYPEYQSDQDCTGQRLRRPTPGQRPADTPDDAEQEREWGGPGGVQPKMRAAR